MNLHGYLARGGCSTAATRASTSPTSTSIPCCTTRSGPPTRLPRERGKPFGGFEKSAYASGEFFDKYVDKAWEPQTQKVRDLFGQAGFTSPTRTTGVR